MCTYTHGATVISYNSRFSDISIFRSQINFSLLQTDIQNSASGPEIKKNSLKKKENKTDIVTFTKSISEYLLYVPVYKLQNFGKKKFFTYGNAEFTFDVS